MKWMLLALVMVPWPAIALVAAGDVRTGWGHDPASWSIPMGSDPKNDEPWDAWMQVPKGEPRGKIHPETPDWTRSQDGKTRRTPTRRRGATFALEEGPYYRTKEAWGALRLTVQYRALDRQPVTPKPPPFPHTNQDFSDSGIYIFNRYEVLIIDPSKFDGPNDPDGGVPTGGEIMDDPRVKPGGRVVPNNRNQQVPGGLYGVDMPSGRYINRANKTLEWNTLVIEFRPPEPDPADTNVIRVAAHIKTMLNGHVVFDGEIKGPDGRPLNGTGVMRNSQAPVTRGYIYLQSHWGSQVEFRDPRIEDGSVMDPANCGPG
jgi:hypothetical protein